MKEKEEQNFRLLTKSLGLGTTITIEEFTPLIIKALSDDILLSIKLADTDWEAYDILYERLLAKQSKKFFENLSWEQKKTIDDILLDSYVRVVWVVRDTQ